jgi:hypothetical protein
MMIRTVTTAVAVLATGGTIATSAAAPASATTNQLHIASVASPAWVAARGLPVAVTVTNPAALVFCSPIAVSITWRVGHGALHRRTVSEIGAAGAWAGSIRIPGRYVHKGRLHYTVSAYQECGLWTAANEYNGRAHGSTRVL